MTIDDKLGPISKALGPIGRAYHAIDDEVRRYYTKIGQRHEKEGGDTKRLGYRCAMASFYGAIMEEWTGAVFNGTHIPLGFSFFITGGVTGLLYTPGVSVIKASRENGTRHDGLSEDGECRTVNQIINSIWRLARGPRLTYLLGGAAAMAAGGVQIVNGLIDKDSHALGIGAYLFSNGLGAVTHASGLYLIDTDPRLLDKAPAWKRALDSARDAITPRPAPVPVPAKGD